MWGTCGEKRTSSPLQLSASTCPALLLPHLRPRPSCRRVLSAELFGLEPAAHDKTLYPSDHAALRVGLRIWRDPAAPLPPSVEVAATCTGAKL